jgi:DNA-binding beta-propeller fold protein YncE
MMMSTSRGRLVLGLFCTLAAFSDALVATSRADLLAGDFKFNSVFRFDEEEDPVIEVAGGIPAGSAGLEATAGVEVGPDGNIYVSSQNTGEVLFYDGPTGAPLPSPLPGGRDGLFALLRTESQPGGAPGPLRFGPDGNLYVSDFGGTSVRVFNGTTGAELAPAATGFGPPGGLTFAPNGDLYVGNFGTSAVIRVRNGMQQPFIASGTGPILTPSAMLLVPNGDMLVVSMFANEIHRYSAAGAYLGVFATIEPVPPPVDVTNYPSDIAFDADGNIVVAVLGATNPPDNRGQILRFALNEDSVAGTLLDTLVDAYPPMGSIAWIRPADAIMGDYNSDGTVNAADLNKWRSDFGKWVAKGGGADGNGDGIVDSADYVVWRKAFASGTATGTNTALPEPAAAVFAVIAAAFLSCRRNTRQAILTSPPPRLYP